MIDALVIGNAVDSGGVELPVALADGIELTLADAEMAATLRDPLRRLERQLSLSGDNKHPEATVLDRRVSAKPFGSSLRLSEVFGSPSDVPDQFGQGGWIEYGRDGSDHHVVKHDISPDRTYHLIRLAHNDHLTIMTVISALSIGEHPLLCPLGLIWDGRSDADVKKHGHGWVTARISDGANDELREAWSTKALANPLVVNEDWVQSVGQLVAAMRPIVAGSWPGIRAAFERRLELQSVPLASPLRHLGYFIIMEALLTHAPAHGDPADSLGRQLQTKLPLLSNRMQFALPFEDLDPAASPSTVLSALYSYRSAIAHGTDPSFDGKQRVLGSREKVGAFLEIATRRLLRQAVLEPQLVTDLKGPAR